MRTRAWLAAAVFAGLTLFLAGAACLAKHDAGEAAAFSTATVDRQKPSRPPAPDDDYTPETLIVDDGDVDLGVDPGTPGAIDAQGFAPHRYPARLTAVSWYLFESGFNNNQVRLEVYYGPKATGPQTAIYESPAMNAGTDGEWTDVDLSTITALDTLLVSDELYVGLKWVSATPGCPIIGFDNDASPNNDAWSFYPGDSQWTNWSGVGSPGAFVIRATVSYPVIDDDDDDDDDNDTADDDDDNDDDNDAADDDDDNDDDNDTVDDDDDNDDDNDTVDDDDDNDDDNDTADDDDDNDDDNDTADDDDDNDDDNDTADDDDDNDDDNDTADDDDDTADDDDDNDTVDDDDDNDDDTSDDDDDSVDDDDDVSPSDDDSSTADDDDSADDDATPHHGGGSSSSKGGCGC